MHLFIVIGIIQWVLMLSYCILTDSSLQKVCEVSSGDNGSKASGAVESPNIVPGRESWQDGELILLPILSVDNSQALSSVFEDDDEGDDDYFEEEDMFSRLEASRAKLEEELGCDTFLKAYKTVQVCLHLHLSHPKS